MIEYKAVAMDLDDTLLTSDLQISEETKQTYQTGNQQGTSRRYQLCSGVRTVRFVYRLCSRLHQEDK